MKKYYAILRALHLYFGLFISPLVVVFAVSVLVINHKTWSDKILPPNELPERLVQLDTVHVFPSDSLMAKTLLIQLQLSGEIDWITHGDSTFSFPVNKPGSITWVSLNLYSRKVTLSEQQRGVLEGMVYLHKMPGQHNAKLRGNSFLIRSWRIAVDTFVYFTLFVTTTGFLVWYLLRPERKLGKYALGAGIAILVVLLIIFFGW